jgi:hypothetical protein
MSVASNKIAAILAGAENCRQQISVPFGRTVKASTTAHRRVIEPANVALMDKAWGL